MLSEIELANLEELEIKLEVYRVFMGISQATAADFPSETECRLGRWYYAGEGSARFADREGFRALEEPHRQVHVQAGEAVSHFHAGNQDAALAALAAMEHANLDVMTRLRQVMRGGHIATNTSRALPEATLPDPTETDDRYASGQPQATPSPSSEGRCRETLNRFVGALPIAVMAHYCFAIGEAL